MTKQPQACHRVLIVDDSPTISGLIGAILEREPDFTVIGTATNGKEAVAMAARLKPDLITMDVQMPEMDGLQATQRIMESAPCRIVMVTAASRIAEMQVPFKAVEAGALAVVEKPKAVTDEQFRGIRHELLETLRSMSQVPVFRRLARNPEASLPLPRTRMNLVAMGASTGGPQVLNGMLSALPAEFPCPLLIAQHMSSGFIAGMARWLDGNSALCVQLAQPGEVLRPGHVYLAPDDRHLTVKAHNGNLLAHHSQRAPVDGFRPSATALFESVALACPGRAVGVILTGMGHDGAAGLKKMRAAGCMTIAQSEADCLVYSMPKQALKAGAARHSMSPREIVTCLIQCALQNP